LRAEAATALRSVIKEIRLVPEDGRLEIELAGDLAGILALAAGNKKPAMSGHGGLQLTVVAGRRNCLYLLLFATNLRPLAPASSLPRDPLEYTRFST
jgi:hypothetical protein